MYYQIAISGNVGVGKSTLGPKIANAINAPWLSETKISDMFSYLIADQCAHSKLITQLAFPTTQVASILSCFLSGKSVVVTERSMWDHLLFFNYWTKKYELNASSNEIKKNLFQILRNHPIRYEVLTIFLRCDSDILSIRTASRGKAFDSTFNSKVLNDLHNMYETALQNDPPNIIGVFDVTSLNIDDSEQIQNFTKLIAERINGYKGK